MAAQGSVANALHMMHLIDQLRQGRALFSTNRGTYPARRATSTVDPVILRSQPMTDVQSMVAYLRETFPVACRTIRLPIHNLYHYFDHFDVHLHGTNFIQHVLDQIGRENINRTQTLLRFVHEWTISNINRFMEIVPDSGEDTFNEEERDIYDEGFLEEALLQLKRCRTDSDAVNIALNEAAQARDAQLATEQAAKARAAELAAEQTAQKLSESRASDYQTLVAASRNPSTTVSPPGAASVSASTHTRPRGESARMASPESSLAHPAGQHAHSEGDATEVPTSSVAAPITNMPPQPVVPAQVPAFQTPSYSGATQRRATAGGRQLTGPATSHVAQAQPSPTAAGGLGFPPMASFPGPAGFMPGGTHGPVAPPVYHPGMPLPYPIYSTQPIQAITIPTNLSHPMIPPGFPQHAPPFSQGFPMMPSQNLAYQGHQIDPNAFPRVRPTMQDQHYPFPAPPNIPYAYAGYNQSGARHHGRPLARPNPPKPYSDDARVMQPEQSSSASYPAIYRGEMGSQHQPRGFRRNSAPRSRRPLVSNFITPPDTIPQEARYSHSGRLGGRGSGESQTVHESTQEGQSIDDGQQRASAEPVAEPRVHTVGVSEAVIDTPRAMVPESAETATQDGERHSLPQVDGAITTSTSDHGPTYEDHQRPSLLDNASQAHLSTTDSTYQVNSQVAVYGRRLFLIAQELTLYEVEVLCYPFGSIEHIYGPKLTHNEDSGRVYYFVTYHRPADAEAALNSLHRTRLTNSRVLTVELAFGRSSEGDSGNLRRQTYAAEREAGPGVVQRNPACENQPIVSDETSAQGDGQSTSRGFKNNPQSTNQQDEQGEKLPQTPKNKKQKNKKGPPSRQNATETLQKAGEDGPSSASHKSHQERPGQGPRMPHHTSDGSPRQKTRSISTKAAIPSMPVLSSSAGNISTKGLSDSLQVIEAGEWPALAKPTLPTAGPQSRAKSQLPVNPSAPPKPLSLESVSQAVPTGKDCGEVVGASEVVVVELETPKKADVVVEVERSEPNPELGPTNPIEEGFGSKKDGLRIEIPPFVDLAGSRDISTAGGLTVTNPPSSVQTAVTTPESRRPSLFDKIAIPKSLEIAAKGPSTDRKTEKGKVAETRRSSQDLSYKLQRQELKKSGKKAFGSPMNMAQSKAGVNQQAEMNQTSDVNTPPLPAESSTSASMTISGSNTGKIVGTLVIQAEEFKSDAAPRTPSPAGANRAPIQGSSPRDVQVPKSGKRRERYEFPSRVSSSSVVTEPISTHKKKKRVGTPAKPTPDNTDEPKVGSPPPSLDIPQASGSNVEENNGGRSSPVAREVEPCDITSPTVAHDTDISKVSLDTSKTPDHQYPSLDKENAVFHMGTSSDEVVTKDRKRLNSAREHGSFKLDVFPLQPDLSVGTEDTTEGSEKELGTTLESNKVQPKSTSSKSRKRKPKKSSKAKDPQSSAAGTFVQSEGVDWSPFPAGSIDTLDTPGSSLDGLPLEGELFPDLNTKKSREEDLSADSDPKRHKYGAQFTPAWLEENSTRGQLIADLTGDSVDEEHDSTIFDEQVKEFEEHRQIIEAGVVDKLNEMAMDGSSGLCIDLKEDDASSADTDYVESLEKGNAALRAGQDLLAQKIKQSEKENAALRAGKDLSSQKIVHVVHVPGNKGKEKEADSGKTSARTSETAAKNGRDSGPEESLSLLLEPVQLKEPNVSLGSSSMETLPASQPGAPPILQKLVQLADPALAGPSEPLTLTPEEKMQTVQLLAESNTTKILSVKPSLPITSSKNKRDAKSRNAARRAKASLPTPTVIQAEFKEVDTAQANSEPLLEPSMLDPFVERAPRHDEGATPPPDVPLMANSALTLYPDKVMPVRSRTFMTPQGGNVPSFLGHSAVDQPLNQFLPLTEAHPVLDQPLNQFLPLTEPSTPGQNTPDTVIGAASSADAYFTPPPGTAVSSPQNEDETFLTLSAEPSPSLNTTSRLGNRFATFPRRQSSAALARLSEANVATLSGSPTSRRSRAPSTSEYSTTSHIGHKTPHDENSGSPPKGQTARERDERG